MKRFTFFGVASVALLMLVAAVQPTLAALPPAAGLQVTLVLGGVPAAQTITDSEGNFLLPGMAAGSYALTVADIPVPPAVSPLMSLSFPLEITTTQAPASVAGEVSVSTGVDVGFSIRARVVSASTTLSVTGASISPRKWNVNYSHSNGRIKVRLQGTGLIGVTMVTLSSANGSISSTDIRVQTDEDDEEENGQETAQAVFGKAAAWTALMPAGALGGDIIPIQILVQGEGYSATFNQNIRLLGRHH